MLRSRKDVDIFSAHGDGGYSAHITITTPHRGGKARSKNFYEFIGYHPTSEYGAIEVLREQLVELQDAIGEILQDN